MTPSHSSTGLGGTTEEHLAVYVLEQKKTLSLFIAQGDVSGSVFVGLSLKEFVEAVPLFGKRITNNPVVNVVAYLRLPERS